MIVYDPKAKSVIVLTEEEKSVCKFAYDVIVKLVHAVSDIDGDKIVSPTTGEMIVSNELPCVAGILSGLADVPVWLV